VLGIIQKNTEQSLRWPARIDSSKTILTKLENPLTQHSEQPPELKATIFKQASSDLHDACLAVHALRVLLITFLASLSPKAFALGTPSLLRSQFGVYHL
jgi:hypothetical protein